MSDGFGLKIGVEGEREFKKSLSEINQTFKVMGSEMKLVQSQFDKNDNSVEALTARNATLNKQIDNQKEKISTLKAALENAASSFGENDKRTQAWQIQLNNAEAALNKMERELSQNDQALDSVGDEFSKAEKKADKFGDEIKETGEQAESSGSKFKKVGEVLKTVGVAMAAATAAIGTAAVAAGKKLWDMASETAKAGDEIDKTSQKLGMSAEAYQEWDYVLGQAGVDITSMTTGLKTMTNQIDDAKNGSVKAQERFAKLGISLNDLNTMSREDIFSAVVSGMQGMADTTERAALANDLFGKSGQNLTPLFNETTESTEKLKQAAHDLGFVMSDEAVKASAEFNDSLDTLKRTFSGVKNNLVGELLPGFSTLLNGLSALLAGNDKAKEQIQKGTQEIVNSLKDIFPRVMDILMTLIGAVAEIAPVIIDSLVQGISANMGELVSAASDIVITFLESLIAALPQIAEGAVKLITQLTDAILENLPLLVSTTMQVITTVIDGIADALPALIPAVVSALLDAVQAIIDNIGAFVDVGVKVILALVDGVVQAIPVLIQKIPVIVKSVIEALKNALPTLIDGVKQLISALAKALPEIITSIVEMLPDLLTTIVESVKELLPVLIEGIIDVVNTIIETKLGSYYTKTETDAKLTDRMKVKTQALTNLNQCDSLTDPDTLYQIKYAGVEEILLNTSNSSGQLRLNKNGYIYFRNYNASAGTWSEWTNAMKNIPPGTITTAMIGRLWLSYDNLDDHYIRYFDYTELSSMDELTDYAIYTGVTDDSWRSQYDVDGHFLLLVTENTQLLMFPVSNRVFTRERPNNGDWGTWTDISPVSESSISTIDGEVADNKLTKYYTKTEMNSKLYEKENIVVNTSAQLSDCDNCYATETLYRLIINGQEHLLINAGTRAAQYRFTNGDVFYRVYQNRAWTEWENLLTRIPDDAITGDMIQDSAISADKLEDIYPALHYADEIGGEGDINDWSNGIYIGTLTENWRAHYGVSGHYILIADGMQIMYIPEANRVQFREKGHMGRWDSWEVIDLCSYAVVHREIHGEAGYISENYAWYTEPSQGLSLTGTYTLVGDFCTINGTVPLIEGWETVYYSLPCNSVFSACAVARCGSDVFTVATNTLNNVSVIEIKKLGGGTLPSGTLSFTLAYRYLEPKIGA